MIFRFVKQSAQIRPIFKLSKRVGAERTQLTMRLINGRLVRKTLAFSRSLEMYRASAAWEDLFYNLARPLRTLRQEVNDPQRRWLPRSTAIAAGLSDRIRTVKQKLTTVVPPVNT